MATKIPSVIRNSKWLLRDHHMPGSIQVSITASKSGKQEAPTKIVPNDTRFLQAIRQRQSIAVTGIVTSIGMPNATNPLVMVISVMWSNVQSSGTAAEQDVEMKV
jgi:hypothetical protein